ncbi:MAG: lipocalin family protein [Bdellovibrionota bacterium]
MKKRIKIQQKLQSIFSQIFMIASIPAFSACSTVSFPTVEKVDIERFMGTWYVSAGRFTILEKDVHNAVEIYTYDKTKDTIDIDYTYRKGSSNGKIKKVPQKGYIVAGTNNAHWLVSPFWPLKFDYLVIDLADDYSWVAIGVPNQKYLWIMHRSSQVSRKEVDMVIDRLKAINYKTNDIVFVPQNW